MGGIDFSDKDIPGVKGAASDAVHSCSEWSTVKVQGFSNLVFVFYVCKILHIVLG